VTNLFITGYPRSGNTWTNRLLSDILDSPLQNTPDMEPIYYGETGGKYVILKRHSKVREGLTLFVYRDPRDVAVSRMFYRRLPDLTTAIDGMLGTNGDTLDMVGSVIGEYNEFVRTWYNRADAQIRYEDLHASPVETLSLAILALTGETVDPDKIKRAVERQSFAATVERNGPEHAMRRGQVGDWRNHFNRENSEHITRLFGELMLEQGYIDSLDWWQK